MIDFDAEVHLADVRLRVLNGETVTPKEYGDLLIDLRRGREAHAAAEAAQKREFDAYHMEEILKEILKDFGIVLPQQRAHKLALRLASGIPESSPLGECDEWNEQFAEQ
jgi:hypothetical protein